MGYAYEKQSNQAENMLNFFFSQKHTGKRLM